MNVRDWLGKSVRVYAGFDQRKERRPMAEGEVIAVIDGPSIIVRENSGRIDTWPISLPMDEIPAAEPATRPDGR